MAFSFFDFFAYFIIEVLLLEYLLFGSRGVQDDEYHRIIIYFFTYSWENDTKKEIGV